MNEARQTNPDEWRAPAWLTHLALLSLAVLAPTLVVYWPVLGFDFVNYDDPDYFYSNRHVLAGLNPSGILWAFTTLHAGNWHPLTWLSLMLDSTVFGKDPFGPHLTNVLLHCANSVLLFLWGHALTKARWGALFVAGLFALHPMHVESVAWIAERKDVLSTLFGLLSLLAYTRHAQQHPIPIRQVERPYKLALVFFACSLMSKPMLVTMPFLLLMLDFYPLNRVPVERRSHAIRGLIFEKLPFLVLSMASSIVTYIAQQKGGAVVSLVRAPIEARIANAFVSYASYLEKTFWPTELAVFYPYPEGIDPWRLLFSVALVLGLSAVSLLYIRKFPCGAFGWFWFMGTLVPVIGVVQVGNQAMADRYSYVPLIGVFMIAACGITAACKRFSLPSWTPATVTVLLLSAYGVMASRQVAFWQNSGTLFRHALAVTRNNWPAYNNLGTWLSSNNSSSEAMECFERSLQIRPRNPEALYIIGNIFERAGDWETAINYYTQSLSVGPEEADTLNNLGFALTAMNRMDEAINCFERALRLDPDSPNTHNNLAAALHRQQRYEEAVRHYSLALRFMPDDARIWTNLGDAQIRRGHVTEAIHAYEKAIKISPGDTQISGRLQALKQAMEKYIQAPSEEGRAPRQ